MAETGGEDNFAVGTNSDGSFDESTSNIQGQGRIKDAGGGAGLKTRRQRRKKRRAVRSWDEQQAFEDCDGKNQEDRRGSLLMAPNNTTQFLLEDRIIPQDPGQPTSSSPGSAVDHSRSMFCPDSPKSPLHLREPFEDEDFDEQLRTEFSVAYEDVRMKHLLSMPKEKIVSGYMELEAKIEKLEREVRSFAKKRKRRSFNSTLFTGEDMGGHSSAAPDDLSEAVLIASNFTEWQDKARSEDDTANGNRTPRLETSQEPPAIVA